jgi:hypothetical protein
MPRKLSHEVILAAIEGFESQKRKIDTQVAELRAMLNGHRTELATTAETPTRNRKKFSAATRRRMREAQRRRWASVKGV